MEDTKAFSSSIRPVTTIASHRFKKPTLEQQSATIFECLASFDINKLINILTKIELEESLDIVKLMDDGGHTLIHKAAYDNTYRISDYLIQFYKQRYAKYLRLKVHEQRKIPETQQLEPEVLNNIKREVRKAVAVWINTQSNSDEGFYPLHFASFHGNVKLIKLLVKNGADIWVKNKQGINMLHVAAQGDQAYSLTYFIKKGIKKDSTDDEHSTPLHWACFAGSDTAIYYCK